MPGTALPLTPEVTLNVTVSGQWYTGSAAPAADLGVAGDMYLRTSGAVYQKTADGWGVPLFSLAPQPQPWHGEMTADSFAFPNSDWPGYDVVPTPIGTLPVPVAALVYNDEASMQFPYLMKVPAGAVNLQLDIQAQPDGSHAVTADKFSWTLYYRILRPGTGWVEDAGNAFEANLIVDEVVTAGATEPLFFSATEAIETLGIEEGDFVVACLTRSPATDTDYAYDVYFYGAQIRFVEA